MSDRARWWMMVGAAAAVIAASLVIGPTSALTIHDWLRWPLAASIGAPAPDPERMELVRQILLEVRLPRILLAFLVGAALSGAGAAMQSAFRNPLVDPYVLGISSGAAFAAALALAAGVRWVAPAAFAGGLGAVGLTHVAARGGPRTAVLSLVLAGIVIGGLFTAGLTLVQFWTDPFRLQTIVHWTMGRLHHAGWPAVRLAAPWIVPSLALLLAQAWRLDALALGDDEARAAGLDPVRARLWALAPAVLAASAAVAAGGVIGFYGLVLPHAARLLTGAAHRHLLPAAMLGGGAALVAVDTLSRTVFSFELPVGVFTTALGAPTFLWLLRRSRIPWEA
ncbi:MAG: iron ABC transporter permease [Kiritimatiellae bacterium]|nr:iron ABC transporter permease [Kiritimatiellia bacterium]